MLAGMGGVSYAPLVAAVSEAGGFGCLGASTMGNEQMVAEIAAVRAATDQPFGVDLLTAMPGGMTDQVELIIEGGASAFVAGLGVPSEVVDLCHRHGLLVVNMCGKVDHAVRAVEAGCDLVVAQGTEAGGHTGQVATMPLVPQVVDAVGDRVPVVAAGGIFDGRGLAAALALGADGVWVGTRFIATPEARGVLGYKEALLASAEDGTTVSRAYSGKTMRVITQRVHRRTSTPTRASCSGSPTRWAGPSPTGVMHLGGRRDEHRASTRPGSASRPARGWAASPSWCRRASWSAASSPRPSRRWTAWARRGRPPAPEAACLSSPDGRVRPTGHETPVPPRPQ